MDITGIMQAVKTAMDSKDRRIADLERELADLREQIDEAYAVAAPANLAPEDSGPADWVRLALEKAQADNAAYQKRLKSILVGICPVPDPECSVAEECDISGTCQAMHALLAADHPGAELLVDARLGRLVRHMGVNDSLWRFPNGCWEHQKPGYFCVSSGQTPEEALAHLLPEEDELLADARLGRLVRRMGVHESLWRFPNDYWEHQDPGCYILGRGKTPEEALAHLLTEEVGKE